MPKIANTRKQRANELLDRLRRGPSFSDTFRTLDGPFTTDMASAQFRNWSRSWIIDELIELVPELKKQKED